MQKVENIKETTRFLLFISMNMLCVSFVSLFCLFIDVSESSIKVS